MCCLSEPRGKLGQDLSSVPQEENSRVRRLCPAHHLSRELGISGLAQTVQPTSCPARRELEPPLQCVRILTGGRQAGRRAGQLWPLGPHPARVLAGPAAGNEPSLAGRASPPHPCPSLHLALCPAVAQETCPLLTKSPERKEKALASTLVLSVHQSLFLHL